MRFTDRIAVGRKRVRGLVVGDDDDDVGFVSKGCRTFLFCKTYQGQGDEDNKIFHRESFWMIILLDGSLIFLIKKHWFFVGSYD